MSSKRVFLDSSVLVEYRKGSRTDLLDKLLDDESIELVISQVVASEYLYYLIAIFGGKAPLTIKGAGEIGKTIRQGNPNELLEKLEWAADNKQVMLKASEIMEAYNLLPNDALILSICLVHHIKYIASFDSDFFEACNDLNIKLLQDISDTAKLQNQ